MVVLPAPDGPTRATSWPGSARKVTSKSTWSRAVLLEHGHRLERGERDLLGARVGEVDVVELDGGRAPRERHGAGRSVDHRGQVEHLEDPVEGDQRGHDVDVDVGELRQRPVEPGEVGGHGDQGAHLERAVQREQAAPAVDEGGGQRGGEGERDEEDPGVHRLDDRDVPHPAWPGGEELSSSAGPPEELDQEGPGLTLKRSASWCSSRR
jgi:hypothetical protein